MEFNKDSHSNKEDLMCHYNHLTLIEREKIMYFHAQKYSVSAIARELHRSKSTISRELRRNADDGFYQPASAQHRYTQRRARCHPHRRLDDPKLRSYVRDKFLNQQWSPEEISGRLALEHHKVIISDNTIYRAIYAGLFDDPHRSHGNRSVIRKLRHHGKSRHKKGRTETRGKIRISNDISKRPAGAENRSRRGHWEGDTVAGKVGRACIVTLVDRKTRYLVGGKAAGKCAADVNAVMIAAWQGQPVRSITPDRGKEFAKHAEVTEALDGVKFYFPQPHQPWARGTNENTNGLLREYFPKGQDISDIPEEYIQEMFDKLNYRPRKCLGYKTPYEAYYSKTLHLA